MALIKGKSYRLDRITSKSKEYVTNELRESKLTRRATLQSVKGDMGYDWSEMRSSPFPSQ